MVKLTTQPYCRCCGKAIRKSTDLVYVKDLGEDVVIRTQAEAQRTQNQKVVSVKYSGRANKDWDCDYHVLRHLKAGRVEVGERVIWAFGIWDGESYDDDLFCSGTCAQSFARMAARHYPGLVTVEYNSRRKTPAA